MLKTPVKIFAPVSKDTHQKLRTKAKDRQLPLYAFAKIILEWAGEKDVKDLIGLGIRLPVYGDEFRSADSEGD